MKLIDLVKQNNRIKQLEYNKKHNEKIENFLNNQFLDFYLEVIREINKTEDYVFNVNNIAYELNSLGFKLNFFRGVYTFYFTKKNLNLLEKIYKKQI